MLVNENLKKLLNIPISRGKNNISSFYKSYKNKYFVKNGKITHIRINQHIDLKKD